MVYQNSDQESFVVNTTSEHRGIRTTRESTIIVIPKDIPKPGMILFLFILISLLLVYLIEIRTVSKVFCTRLGPSAKMIDIRQRDIIIDPLAVFRDLLDRI